ncbi:UDP-glucose/GDP-mannose dehydrogenase family protein [Egibacter rhizosphaerae]|uniref:UDP-glucose 6-dehydrogenase n=2 Tax=Egibacter rhizosphaerae TaxID=1670831 RepID=A0A411YLF2_9ACTN|nr:UDP-glucose/GDP-mannose dehydrogenase family protein [Egibacter rhizosphaerae]
MRVGVLGVGHVGLVTAACMADFGHDVIGYDDDGHKIAALRAGDMPFYEPDLDRLVADNVSTGRLRFSGDAVEALSDREVVFICVGTPSREDGSPNLAYVQAAAQAVAAHARGPVVVAEKSTVPVRTGERIRQALALESQARQGTAHHEVVSNPEFLREGSAVEDTLRPDRIVVGADSTNAHEVMRRVYTPQLERHDCPYVETDVKTAELIKHASNAFLATKISFINAVARVCELTGADVETVADAMGHDPRIGRAFLNAGIGYGGSCFPKDVEAFVHIAAELGYDFGLLRETQRINREAKVWPVHQLRRLLWNLQDKEIAVLGVAFKPGTDDIRDAPALDVIDALEADGASVRLHDPVALDQVRGRFARAELYEDAREALRGAHAVVTCTEWDEYRKIEPEQLAELLAYPVVVDGRNVWDPAALEAANLRVASVGTPFSGDLGA